MLVVYRPMPCCFLPLIFPEAGESLRSNKTWRHFLTFIRGKIEGAAKPGDLEWRLRDMFSCTTPEAG